MSVLSVHWESLLLFENKHPPSDWSPWQWLGGAQLACQGVLMGPVDGWLHYCTTACCVTSSCTQHRHALFPIAGCCVIVCTGGNKYVGANKQKHFSWQNTSWWSEKLLITASSQEMRQAWWTEHPAGDALVMTPFPEHSDSMGQAAVLSFDSIVEAEWQSGGKKKSIIGRGAAATTNKLWPRSRCSPVTVLHAIWTTLLKLEKTPLLGRPLKMDEQQGGRWNAGEEEEKKRLFVCTKPHEFSR